MSSGGENRYSPRVSKGYMIRYRSGSSLSDKADWAVSPLRNISETGVSFLSEQLFPAGSELEMQLLLPSTPEPIIVKGTVVAIRQTSPKLMQLGIQFTDPDAEAQAAIRQAISKFLRRPD